MFEDGSALGDDQMQRLAREMNLPKTVLLLPAEYGGDARMRIFTPPLSWHLPVIEQRGVPVGSQRPLPLRPVNLLVGVVKEAQSKRGPAGSG